MRNVVGFTNNSRGRSGRARFGLGKTSMFLNDFQGFVEFDAQRPLPN